MPKAEIKKYIQELMRDAEEWRAIKMVVVGNGRIGKTTLLHSVNDILNSSSISVYILNYVIHHLFLLIFHSDKYIHRKHYRH